MARAHMEEYYPEKMSRIVGQCSNPKHCKHSGKDISESTYRFKGCWGCEFFSESESFPYINVKTAGKLLFCSKSRIYNMIKEGQLDGELFKQKQWTGFAPAPDKMHITKESVEKMLIELDLKSRLKRIQRACNDGIFSKDHNFKNEQFKDILRVVSRTLDSTRVDIRRCLDKPEAD